MNIVRESSSRGFIKGKIREALRQRDKVYKLKNIIELNGAVFDKRYTGNQKDVLFAIKSKDWRDQKGYRKTKAGFAKVLIAKETRKNLNQYLSEYTFRFNRRHDPDSLFFRALGACVHSKPVTS